MKVCVIGGANVDITASSASVFKMGDSNPGRVNVSWGGVARNIAHNLALLGDEPELLTVFGGGHFGPVLAEACRRAGIGVDHSEIAAEGVNSFFVSINNANGELLGGVADMSATEAMTPEWLAAREALIAEADAVVADANSSPAALAWLIDNSPTPLFLDAVSVAKAPRIVQAVALSGKKGFYALKCNSLEYQEISDGLKNARIERRYVSQGAEGLQVYAGGERYFFPALPCIVRSVTGGGDALLAGIVHAGVEATVMEAARKGLLCARCAVSSPDAVSEEIKELGI